MSAHLPGVLVLCLTQAALAAHEGSPWKRHVIDSASRGADGVRLADVNGDGRPDIATGWEEGGMIRLYLHPGRTRVTEPWPAVTVGRVADPEDAVLADLDGDGAMDLISSCEGNTRTIHIHWSPGAARRMDPSAWRTEPLPASKGAMMWMWCVPMQVDGRNGLDLVAGAKGPGAQVGWFEAPADPRRLDQWRWHPLREAGWIMSILPADMDGDGDQDLLISDRKGGRRGIDWLEHPAKDLDRPWPVHPVGAAGREVMFLALADLDGDNRREIIAAVKPAVILCLRQDRDGAWHTTETRLPATVGAAKCVAAGDIDLDGRVDLVYTTEGATNGKSGVVWLSYDRTPFDPAWTLHEISGADGVKHDLAVLQDLDEDGDLDLLTCEETRNLGVIWYENPARRK